MESVETATFHLEISPRPVLLNLQGARRTDPDTEPAFEAMELLRRHYPSKALYSYTPEEIIFIDENLPGSYINFYEIRINSQTTVTLITVNMYRGNDFILAEQLIEILGNSVTDIVIINSFPTDEPPKGPQRDLLLYSNTGHSVSPGVFQFAFGGILAEFGLTNITEIIISHPHHSNLGIDGITIASIYEQLWKILGCQREQQNTESSLMRTLAQLQGRYTQNAKNQGLW